MPSSPSLNTSFAPPKHPTQYRCLGIIKGIYKPSVKKLRVGTLILETGKTYLCYLANGKIAKQIRSQNPEHLSQPQLYRTWITTLPTGVVRSFQLLSKSFNPQLDSPINLFSLRGALAQIDRQAQTVQVAIARNETPPPGKEQARKWQPSIQVFERKPKNPDSGK